MIDDKLKILNNFMTNEKQRAMVGFKKAKSLLEKIIKMTEEDKYCIDIMQQNLAVIGLLKSAHQSLFENHLHTCFKNAMASKDEKVKAKMVEEILRVSKLVNK
jgi:DNA-binding FrmR family transcriptional regulator